jgi:hypothetical protein
LAKNNLKTINSNNVSINSDSQIYSKYSYTYNLFLYLNVIKFITVFNNLSFFNILKNKLILTSLTFNFYKLYKPIKNNFKKEYVVSTDIKIFFLNGFYSYIFDYFNLKKFTTFKKIIKKKIIFKSLFVYKNKKKIFNVK